MTPFANLPRREFLKLVGASTLLRPAIAEDTVSRWFQSLTREQRGRLVFPFEHPLRSIARNNWRVVEPRIADLAKPQQELCREVLERLCSDEGLKRLDRQMNDDYGGFARYHVAIFGDPAEGPSQWVLTGRHLTIRSDAATGLVGRGPLFLGHSAIGDANIWRGSGRKAAAILGSLGRNREPAGFGTQGLAVNAQAEATKPGIHDLLREMLGVFRGVGVEPLAGAFNDDVAEKVILTFFHDGTIWKLEGPGFAWHYHASPHVHSWLTIHG